MSIWIPFLLQSVGKSMTVFGNPLFPCAQNIFHVLNSAKTTFQLPDKSLSCIYKTQLSFSEGYCLEKWGIRLSVLESWSSNMVCSCQFKHSPPHCHIDHCICVAVRLQTEVILLHCHISLQLSFIQYFCKFILRTVDLLSSNISTATFTQL